MNLSAFLALLAIGSAQIALPACGYAQTAAADAPASDKIAANELFVDQLLSRMTLEEKIG